MIRVADALKLAYTKIRTRKIRLFVTVFVASLLFAGLTAGSLIFRGITRSVELFSSEGFSKRYIVAGSFTDTSQFNAPIGMNTALIARAEALEKVDADKRKAVAKRLGIENIANEADKAVGMNPDGSKYLNIMTPIGQQVIKEETALRPTMPDITAFQKQVGTPSAKYYRAESMALMGAFRPPSLLPLKNGQEKILNRNLNPYDVSQGIDGIASGWTLLDDSLMQPFLLPGQDLSRGTDGTIPIVISYSAAQEILNIPKLDGNATLTQKKQRLSDVRRDIAGKSFEVCYRNEASYRALQNAAEQQADIKQNAGKKDYQKPELVYALPKTACAAPVVERDVRSADTKLYDSKRQQYEAEFGAQAPASELLHFRVVGITPDNSYGYGGAVPSVEDLLRMVTTSSLGFTWVSPLSFKDNNPALQDIFRPTDFSPMESSSRYFAEFATIQEAREALKTKNCVAQYPGMPLDAGMTACSLDDRPFTLQSFGSASLVLEDISEGFRKFQLIAAGVVTVIASIILMGMIGRIIADARKETAVFRAVGASRLTIAQVYVVYTLYLVGLIVAIAFAIGFVAALYVNNNYGPNTSIVMALLFNVADLGKEFHYYAIDWYDVGLITLVVGAASLIGAAVPIAHNMQRNPIRDMRDE